VSTMCLVCRERDAHHRYACAHCVRGLQRQLRELETYVAVLVVLSAPVRKGMDGVAGGYGSRAPARDDVMTALDPRSGGGAAVWRLRDPRDMDDAPVRSVTGSIRGIACWIRDVQDVTSPPRWSFTSEIAYLMGQMDWAAMHSWIAELADDLTELHRQARVLARDQPPGPINGCLTVGCEGYVYPATLRESTGDTHDGARCARCRRVYSGTDLARLYASQQVRSSTSDATGMDTSAGKGINRGTDQHTENHVRLSAHG